MRALPNGGNATCNTGWELEAYISVLSVDSGTCPRHHGDTTMSRPSALWFALFNAFLAVSAQAQASRTWVSGMGDDAFPCSRTAPCKTFNGAFSKTATNGEISVLDPAGFGAVT